MVHEKPTGVIDDGSGNRVDRRNLRTAAWGGLIGTALEQYYFVIYGAATAMPPDRRPIDRVPDGAYRQAATTARTWSAPRTFGTNTRERSGSAGGRRRRTARRACAPTAPRRPRRSPR